MINMRTGVIGVGHLGRFHAQKYAAISQLAGVFDENAERAAEVAAELGCRAFPSVDALLAEVDAVSIVTPTSTHFAVAEVAMQAGVHCLVEKPFTLDTEEADALIGMAQERHLVLAIGHIKRVHPAIQHLRQAGFGAPRYLEAERLAPFKPRSLDIDVIMDLMIHDLDLTLLLTGAEPVDVRAVGVAAVTDKADMATAWMTLNNGTVANLAASRVVREPARRMRIFWQDRYASVDFLNNTLHIYHRGAGTVPGIPGVRDEVVDLPKRDALAAEIEDFLNAIVAHRPVFCDGIAGRRVLAAALQVRVAVEAFLQH
ncbi:Gfo/Idh/MocA family oxidoreductase [Acidithiobacillus sp.]|jgi:predicted dehydrogenase|uniref:Gfo/Idh/MocA family protein n=2 Tax=Acidithiobacillus sp. TaxID=1872118 RepID=UPI0026101BA4|nr:Gfo/Idh/MocA family oxidoreductase [Acidithiobacillus sp.]